MRGVLEHNVMAIEKGSKWWTGRGKYVENDLKLIHLLSQSN